MNKTISTRIIGLLTAASIVMVSNVAPAAAADTSATIDGVIYTMDGAGAAYVSGYTSDLPAKVSIALEVSIDAATLPVTRIGEYAFLRSKEMMSIEIPDSVTSIEQAAFGYAYSLQSVQIPSSVTSIGQNAFAYASSLVSVSIPDSVTKIEVGLFAWATALQSVQIPSSVTSIEQCAFYGDSSLESLTIPASVKSIGASVFDNASGLQSLYFQGAAPEVGENAFRSASPSVFYHERFAADAADAGFTSPTWQGLDTVSFEEMVKRTPTDAVLFGHSGSLKPKLKIKGSAKVGNILRVANRSWSKSRKVSFQWFANGKRIPGANRASYKLQVAQAGARIAVRVTSQKIAVAAAVKKARVLR